MLFCDFYDKYTKYLSSKKLDIISKTRVSKLLNANEIPTYAGTGNKVYLEMSAEELYQIFNSRKWIYDIDDIHHLYSNE
jgi:hypothetical protein